MEITSVTVRKRERENSRMKGIASVIIDDCFKIHDIRIIEGDNGLFIAMPSRKTTTGGYRDIAHPMNSETRELFEKAILEAYDKAEDLDDNTEEQKYSSFFCKKCQGQLYWFLIGVIFNRERCLKLKRDID